jgi:hypothetical protein
MRSFLALFGKMNVIFSYIWKILSNPVRNNLNSKNSKICLGKEGVKYMMKIKRKTLGILFMLMSITISSVSAYVYETAQLTLTQTVKEIATITLKGSSFGVLKEGQTLLYTKANSSNLGTAITLATTEANVYMHLTSDIASQSAWYSTFNVVVKIATKPSGGTHTVGETVATLSLASPNSGSIDLDVLGTWTFDFEVTTTAKPVSADHATTVTITATAEST